MMYTKHCVNCKKIIKDEDFICPYCGEYQPSDTEEKKENAKRKREFKWAGIAACVMAIVMAIPPTGGFWSRIIIGAVAGFFTFYLTLLGFSYVKDKDDKDKK